MIFWVLLVTNITTMNVLRMILAVQLATLKSLISHVSSLVAEK